VTDVTELVQAAESADVRVGLRAAVALRRLAERLEELQVERARGQGWSWQQIADVLEVTRQAVHKRYAHRA
jgi:DNA-directed RNA polymerase specialized sigma24 family protein